MNTCNVLRSTSATAPPSLLAGNAECQRSPPLVKLSGSRSGAGRIRTTELDWLVYGHTLVIEVGKILDITNHRDFRRAYENASTEVRTYVVDFGKTTWIDCSVLGMLLLLRKHAGGSREHIHLIDVGPGVRNILGTVNLNALFTMDTSAAHAC